MDAVQEAAERLKKAAIRAGMITAVEAIRALDGVCDNATIKDGVGFSKFDRAAYEKIIDKALDEGYLTRQEEDTAIRMLKKYEKQLAGLGISFHDLDPIPRETITYEVPISLDSDFTELADKKKYPLDPVGFTNRLEVIEHNKLRFCSDTGAWHLCKDNVWGVCTPQQAANEVDNLYNELVAYSTIAEDREPYIKAAMKVSGYKAACDLLNKLAGRDSTNIKLNQLNTKDNLLVVGNGTINLLTGKLLDTDPQDFHSLKISTKYVKGASRVRWEQFLNEIFPGSPETISFLKRAVGMSLFGSEKEYFIICYGEGANGKSVFLDVVKAILEDYADKASISTFIVGKMEGGNAARSDIVRLIGRRMIVASENKKQVTLDAGIIKEWTGDREMAARGLYKSEVKFIPKGTLWFATNHKPTIDDDSDGTWRRCIMVHFDTQIPEERRDRALSDKIIAAEAEGVLEWAVEGALEFMENGLAVPEKVKETTSTYREEQMPALQFVNEQFEDGDGTVEWQGIMGLYRLWQAENDYISAPRKDADAVTKALRIAFKGSQKVRKNKGYVVEGITLKVGEDDGD